jgi:hypothetical protein
MAFSAILVSRETVKKTDAVGFRQIRLGTAACSVSGVPGTAAAAIAVGKTDLGVGSAIGSIQVSVRRSRSRALVAGPVIASVIETIGECGAIGLSTGEHFVPSRKPGGFSVIPVVIAWIGIVIQARQDLAFFRQPGELIQIISLMSKFHRITVQVRKILRDHFAIEVVPGTFADAVARVHCRLVRPRLRAQVSVPGAISSGYSLCERLTMCISAGQSAEITAVANGLASYQKKFIIGDGFAPRGYSPGLGACASNRQDARKSVQDNIRAEDLILVMYRSKCERRVTQGASRGQPLSPCLSLAHDMSG